MDRVWGGLDIFYVFPQEDILALLPKLKKMSLLKERQ